MSDNKGNINSSVGKILDYLRDLLGGRERNALERNLEKDAFEKEAMEGFQTLSPDELESDLRQIKSQLNTRINRGRRIMIYRIAAGIAIILSLSLSYLLVFNRQMDEFPENLRVSEQIEREEKSVDKAFDLTGADSNQTEAGSIDEIRESEIPKKEAKPVAEDKIASVSKPDKADEKTITPEETVFVMDDEDLTEVTLEFSEEYEVAEVREQMVVAAFKSTVEKGVGENLGSQADSEVISPVAVNEFSMEKSASRAKKSAATPTVSAAESDVTVNEMGFRMQMDSVSAFSLEEVLIIDLDEDKEISNYIPAKPETGMRNYRKYLYENIRIQEALPEKNRAVVILGFIINEKGKAEQFRLIESPDTSFSKEAIRLIEEGPLWIPAKRSGIFSPDEIRLRIVFKNKFVE
ncbi:MAG: energy transducer TonB [Bacteroidales bacterium]|nr:energy transducer TonB [Bacteroidales bacterium]MCF8390964.1 energy transducer TonB [Bacteroidales bacterium]